MEVEIDDALEELLVFAGWVLLLCSVVVELSFAPVSEADVLPPLQAVQSAVDAMQDRTPRCDARRRRSNDMNVLPA